MVRVAVVNELHMDVFGDGVPALFVHGSFGWGLETFPEQRALADQYQVVLIDRCGFGGSTSLEAEGWPVDMHNVATLLDAFFSAVSARSLCTSLPKSQPTAANAIASTAANR
jgi:pimeloyl-ACP methyl ester carboxylesterase